MALCLTQAMIAVSGTSSLLVDGVAIEPRAMLVVDTTVVDMALCTGVVVESASEYQSHYFITSRADAELIAGAFIVLLAIAGTYRYIVEVFSGPDDSMSDEKH